MAYPRLSVKQQPNILFYMERCLIITNQQAITNKQAASLEDYNFFSYVYTRSAFFICWWKLFVKLWKLDEGQKNDFVEGAAYCLKMNFCRKTLIKQDRFTQNREEIV